MGCGLGYLDGVGLCVILCGGTTWVKDRWVGVRIGGARLTVH